MKLSPLDEPYTDAEPQASGASIASALGPLLPATFEIVKLTIDPDAFEYNHWETKPYVNDGPLVDLPPRDPIRRAFGLGKKQRRHVFTTLDRE